MTSSTGWRDTARINANKAFLPRPWPLSRIGRRISSLLRRGRKRRERLLVLAARLADCSANHHLEDLVLAEAGCPRSSDVVIGDTVGVFGNLVDQLIHRRGKPCIVKRATTLSP